MLVEKFMEHSYIEEHDIAGRYLMGKLSAQERGRFEEHFKNCAQCLEQLDTIDDLRTGLQIVATEEVERSRSYAKAGLLARVVRLGRANQAILVGGVILLIALPVGLLVLKGDSARRDLAQLTQTAEEWRRKYEEKELAERNLMKEMQARDRQSSAPQDRPAAHSGHEREDRPRPADKVKKAAAPQAVVPAFALSAARSGAPNLSKPDNRIMLSPLSKLLVLLLELEPDTGIQSYRVAISSADGRNIWRESQLKPSSRDALALSLDSSLFKADNYLLTLEGLTAQQSYVLIAQYTFRVVTR